MENIVMVPNSKTIYVEVLLQKRIGKEKKISYLTSDIENMVLQKNPGVKIINVVTSGFACNYNDLFLHSSWEFEVEFPSKKRTKKA